MIEDALSHKAMGNPEPEGAWALIRLIRQVAWPREYGLREVAQSWLQQGVYIQIVPDTIFSRRQLFLRIPFAPGHRSSLTLQA